MINGERLTMKKIVTSAVIAFAAVTAASAADIPLKAKKAPPMPSWWDTLTITGLVEVGASGNANSPAVTNFGQLFTDKANSAFLNQASLTVQRPLDPKATGYAFGFKFQAMYGSDARYTHPLFQLPGLTSCGIDLKVGQYVTLEGAEVIYAPDNALYTHSYIFNFGIP